jgi:hypothetical protein
MQYFTVQEHDVLTCNTLLRWERLSDCFYSQEVILGYFVLYTVTGHITIRRTSTLSLGLSPPL